MKTKAGQHQDSDTAQKLVLEFLQAINNETFDQARKVLADDFTFKGVLGSRNGADAYMDDMKKLKFRYEVKKIFTAQNDICINLEFTQGGHRLPAFSWYHVASGKVKSLEVIFDPRPLLETTHKN
jgi:hypothetical protein